MASIKYLKKDVNYIMGEMISDSLACIPLMHDESKKKELIEVINKVVEARNGMFSKINNPPVFTKRPERREYFRGIYNDMHDVGESIYEKLNSFIDGK